MSAWLTVDLGFGDAGKGTVVDFLTRDQHAHTVVRFCGGAQAGHRVVDGDREHVFSQFGSGTLAGARTFLSRFMLLEPLAMTAEARHLEGIGVADPLALMTIDERALVITPFQRAVNRLRELARGAGRHGSCGIGVGETAHDALLYHDDVVRAGDLLRPDRLRASLETMREVNRAKVAGLRAALQDVAQAEAEWSLLDDDDVISWLLDSYGTLATQVQIVPGAHLGSLLREPGAVVFEAAQGVLLDEWRGFHPYTTWSTTTLANAHTLLHEVNYGGTVNSIGITRAYTTRHGAGPFPGDDSALTTALPDARNGFHAWQQGFRVGWLDLVLLRYALEVVGPLDSLAVTCLDRLAALPEWQVCAAYATPNGTIDRLEPSSQPHDLEYQEGLTTLLENSQPLLEAVDGEAALLDRIETVSDLPVRLLSHGPDAASKRWR